MASSSASCYFLVALFAFFSVQTMITTANAKDCYLSTIGGGCPDLNQCQITCATCYRGIGIVTAFCESGGSGTPYEQCICKMSDGAPCSLSTPPKCPNWPRAMNSIDVPTNV